MKNTAILFSLLFITFTSIGQNINQGKVWEVKEEGDYLSILPQLKPGDELILQEGIYEGAAIINNSGLKGKNITIRGYGKGEERPVLLLESRGNLMQVNGSNIVLEFLEFRSKYGYSMRIGTSKEKDSYKNIIIKNCVFRECGGGDISANSSLVYDNIQILENYFIGSKKTPVYIGIHNGRAQVTNFVFRGNVIDGTKIFGENITGYGIQLKLNVAGGIIENNFITGTKGPGIMVYGSEDADPENANVVRNNVVVGSRNSAGIVAGGGPSIIEDNLTVRCNGGISVQNYAGRNLLHNITLNNNTAICNRNYGITFGNVQDITARHNIVFTTNNSTAFINNVNKGVNNKIIQPSPELEKTTKEELMKVIPERNNLKKIWRHMSSGPLKQNKVNKIMDLILEHKIVL